ncbi:MAG: cryptochrome/photolyase family protein [Devosia sp.]
MRSAALVWFRTDLRLADNPALAAALRTDGAVTALFIHETDPALRPIGAAARWWQHHALERLGRDLAEIGIPLRVEIGHARAVIQAVVKDAGITHAFWNRRYAPAECEHDAAIKQALKRSGVEVQSFNSHLLVEPFDIATGAGTPYGVFTPFWKSLRQRDIPSPDRRPASQRKPISAPKAGFDSDYVEPAWAAKFHGHWRVGEAAAIDVLDRFLDERLKDYPEGRDIPGKDFTSQLSPYLRHGEIGPRQVWHRTLAFAEAHPAFAAPAEKFLSEVGWREFSYHLLHHRPDIASKPMQEKYARLAWRDAPAALEDWRRGRTGIPIIDAGMRQLWETGWMHNRVRMLVASLLAKNLLIDWREGESWFWDTLVDADIANNPASWQWVAGSGADAAPYFRIFNPVTQAERHDPAGDYVRKWVPELASLPDQWIHKPADAPPDVVRKAGVTIGKTYPAPIVDLGSSRQRALDALKAL